MIEEKRIWRDWVDSSDGYGLLWVLEWVRNGLLNDRGIRDILYLNESLMKEKLEYEVF